MSYKPRSFRVGVIDCQLFYARSHGQQSLLKHIAKSTKNPKEKESDLSFSFFFHI